PAVRSHRDFSGDNTLRILSAGCSRGQEPYSIGISVLEEKETLKGLDTTIYALDLSANVLDVARRGVYPAGHLRDVDERMLSRYFEPIENGTRQQHYRVADDVRNMVRFQCHNLLNDLPGPI